MGSIPFVDYYAKNKISPFNQDMKDLGKLFHRRGALYKHLGIPPIFVQGKTVLEFGPGSGHNSVFTNSLGPKSYVLVDANPTGIKATEQNLLKYSGPEQRNFVVINSLIEEFQSPDRYDLVLCEGLLSVQLEPKSFVRFPAQFVKPGGVLVITCSDSIASLSDHLRSLMAALLVEPDDSLQEKTAKLIPIFSKQFSNLKGMSRPVEDWIVDNIQRFEADSYGPGLFSMEEAIQSLKDDFIVYGSSPDINTDIRWYKDIFYAESEKTNELFIRNYIRNVHNLISYKLDLNRIDYDDGLKLIEQCDRNHHSVMKFLRCYRHERDNSIINDIIEHLAGVSGLVSAFCQTTAAAIEEFIEFLKLDAKLRKDFRFDQFNHFFGRGMLYLSLIRK